MMRSLCLLHLVLVLLGQCLLPLLLRSLLRRAQPRIALHEQQRARAAADAHRLERRLLLRGKGGELEHGQ
jgi:hypothetical protein